MKKSSSKSKRSWCCPILCLTPVSSDTIFIFILLEICKSCGAPTVDMLASIIHLRTSLYSQLALPMSVTGTGGNFLRTGAEEGARSLEAGPDLTPLWPHADTGPSEEEAQLRRGENGEVLFKVRGKSTYLTQITENTTCT